MKKALFIAALMLAPAMASATTVVVEGGGPYDISADTLFTGIAISSAGGAGTYTVDFVAPGPSFTAVADAAVTAADVNTIFTGLTMSWLDGQSLNTLVQSPGIDTLTTVFTGAFLAQRLQFSWTDSVQDAGFGFDVSITPTPVPLPASVLLLGAALVGLGVLQRKRARA